MLKLKKIKAVILGLAIMTLASLPNQANAFTVNETDLYLILSNNSTEAYVDLGNTSSILSGGTSLNISSFVNSASGASDIHWTILAGTPTGAGDLYFSDLLPSLNGTSTGINISSGLTNFINFQANSGANPTSMTQAASNPNSYLNQFDQVPGSLAQTLTGNQANGTINHNGAAINQTMSLYSGNLSDNVLHLLSMVANVTGSGATGNANYTLTIGQTTVSAVPVPPSLVMFVTGMIALAIIARRKEASV
jgi:hypothetical protein